jgi:phosphoribosylformylglycinamidine synthase
MLKLFGPSAYTKEQHKHLLKKIAQKIDNILHFDTGYLYCVDTSEPYDPNFLAMLTDFLGLDQVVHEPKKVAGELAIVLPKEGVLSSWGVAAVDFVHRLDFQDIQVFERGLVFYIETNHGQPLDQEAFTQLKSIIADEDRDCVYRDVLQVSKRYLGKTSLLPTQVPILDQGEQALQAVNERYLLNLSAKDITFLYKLYSEQKRNPNMIEVMTYAIIRSDHCAHNVFHAQWLSPQKQAHEQKTLFQLLKQTHQGNEANIISALEENAAVLKGGMVKHVYRDARTQLFVQQDEQMHTLHKLEMHNQVCQLDPLRGAAFGIGSELGDHSVVGQGSEPIAAMVGFCVSHLRMERFIRPWEESLADFPQHIASPFRIALQAPIGAAQFNNAFGRPTVGGFFRSFEFQEGTGKKKQCWGFHRPLIASSGLGRVAQRDAHRQQVLAGMPIVLLGRPSMRIGVAGCIMASQSSQNRKHWLDYVTVYHDYPEVQRRCQEVIHLCCSLGENNPIVAMNDVSSGGLANTIIQLMVQCGKGAYITLGNVPVVGSFMHPWEIWSNETQERYVMIVNPGELQELELFAAREHVVCKVIGHVMEDKQVIVEGFHDKANPILTMNLADLTGHMPPVQKHRQLAPQQRKRFEPKDLDLATAARRVLQLPAVADKTCFITIADRSVGGCVVRGPMVGPWQVPVADVAVLSTNPYGYQGQACALGERIPVGVLDTAASLRLACSEVLTNLLAADVGDCATISLGVAWVGSQDDAGYSALYEGVVAFVNDFASQLGIAVVTGDDALSMQTQWQDERKDQHSVRAPVTAVISATASVKDVRNTLTPELNRALMGESKLLYIDLAKAEKGLGGTAVAQVYGELGAVVTEVKDVTVLKSFVQVMIKLRHLILAYHDRSDGGLFVTILEMCIASRLGAKIHLDGLGPTPLLALFHEGPGVVIQVADHDCDQVAKLLDEVGLGDCLYEIGRVHAAPDITYFFAGQVCLSERRVDWHRLWSLMSSQIKQARDDLDCAREAYNTLLNTQDPGLHTKITFPLEQINSVQNLVQEYGRPKVAICREQGCHGYLELALAFEKAGFTPVDVSMTDLQTGRDKLDAYIGLALSGGYSFSDIGGAGKAWGCLILNNPRLKDQFADFFKRPDTFALGVGNGAQALSYLRSLIHGAEHWPYFRLNRSLQFESRLSLVRIEKSQSIFFKQMEGCILPVPVAHCEGRAEFPLRAGYDDVCQQAICLKYVNHFDGTADSYPANPNGSALSAAGVTSADGRVTLLMPRPERVIRSVNMAWCPDSWADDTPWLRMFCNAREWVGTQLS